MAKQSNQATRTRNWTFIHYAEEGLTYNDMVQLGTEEAELEKQLESIGIPCAYNLHYMDKKEDGSYKQPHWHIVVSYSSVKTLKQVQDDFGTIAANGYIQPVRDMRAACRYLSHLDNPEKEQYSRPIEVNGLDISKHFETSDKQKEALKAMKELIRFVNDNSIYYYSELLDLLDALGKDDLYRAAINRRLITPLLAYLKAKDTKVQRMRADMVP